MSADPITTTKTTIAGGVGGKLREARERRGISLPQIANSTKIAVSVLDALERDDISRLPGGIFGRAFVRSFASEVGLDPEATIQEFMAQFAQDSVTVGHPQSEQIDDNEALESDRRMAAAFLGLIALSVPIAGVVLYFSMAGWRTPAAAERPAITVTSAAEAPATAPAGASGPPNDALTTATTPAEKPTARGATSDRLTVMLSVKRRCWISVTVDGQKQIERVLEAGEQRSVDVHRELMLRTGDAGAMSMTLNGADAKPLGRSGEVVTVRLNLANFKEYLAER